ncbi:MAG TPA: hypothetical protein V6C58_12455 [Allocoleopsis sp.]
MFPTKNLIYKPTNQIPLIPKRKAEYRNNYANYQQELLLNAPPSDIAKKCREDFLTFREYVCGHETYNHQISWMELLNTGNSNDYLKDVAGKDTIILSPRGSSKSTFLIEWIAYLIGIHASPDIKIGIKILYISYELKTARQKSQQIQRLLEQKRYREVFPWIRKGRNWSKEFWEIDYTYAGLPDTEEPYTLACAGLRGNTTGKRAHLLIFDDLIKNAESISNPSIREEMISNYLNAIRPTKVPGARQICLGTRFRSDSIYETHFISAPSPDLDSDLYWNVVEQSAILFDESEGEKSYWPERFSLEYLSIERQLDPIAFSYQYQNKIVAIDNILSIDKNYIKYSFLPEQFNTLYLGVDLSSSMKERADYTAMVLGGISYDDNGDIKYYIIDAWQARTIGNIEKLEKIYDMWDKWKHLLKIQHEYIDDIITPVYIGGLNIVIESNGYQKSIEGDYKMFMSQQSEYLGWRIIPFQSRADKMERLRSVTGLFENDQVRFNRGGKLGEVITQLTNFGMTSHDDSIDACVMCLKVMRQRGLSVQTAQWIA